LLEDGWKVVGRWLEGGWKLTRTVERDSSHEVGGPLPVPVNLLGVHPLPVGEAVAGAGEGLGAVGTLVGPGPGVLVYVELEVLVALEGLVAEGTGVGP
jgi:hypothetical protein